MEWPERAKNRTRASLLGQPLGHERVWTKKIYSISRLGEHMAEGVGFEPTIRFPVYTLSKRAPSATRPSLHALVSPENGQDRERGRQYRKPRNVTMLGRGRCGGRHGAQSNGRMLSRILLQVP